MVHKIGDVTYMKSYSLFNIFFVFRKEQEVKTTTFFFTFVFHSYSCVYAKEDNLTD